MRMTFWLLAFSMLAHSSAWAACDANIQATTPDQRFTVDAANGLVTDKVTELVWQRCSLGLSGGDCSSGAAADGNWQAALEAARDSSFAGYNDWRLPDIKELNSIMENKCQNPAINSAVFPNTTAGGYWSSSPYANSNYRIWGINFANGSEEFYYKSNSYYVRLVRGGQ